MKVVKVRNYMAILRNLRNILKEGVSERHIEMICQALTNENAVKYSKQFPFRFYSAYKVLTGSTDPYGRTTQAVEADPFEKQKLVNALQRAMELSVANLPKLGGRTFVTSDNSASMGMNISTKSTVNNNEIASIMASIAHHLGDTAIASVFGQGFAVVPLDPRAGIISNCQKLISTDVGHSTNAFLALQYLNKHSINVDRIFLFSDMQCYDTGSRQGLMFRYSDRSLAEELIKYKQTVNTNVLLYSWDLAGYGTLQFPEGEPGVVLMAGWSDKALKFIYEYEKFDGSMVGAVEAYEPKPVPPPKEE